MKQRGILTVVSGFSGVGKGTMVAELLKKYPQQYAVSVSATTRAPRVGERDGVHYFFLTDEKFQEMIAEDQLLEYAGYVSKYYGTPKEYVMNKLDQGIHVILEIEIQGAMKIKEQFPDTLMVFIIPPSAAILRERLEGRGTETAEVIEARLRRAAEEAEGMDAYEYVITNDVLAESVEELHRLIQSNSNATFRNLTKIQNMKEEIQNFAK
ncbi:MAG: guanylate kinase [Lachnospiraceae bacterium]|nr:guanylate kinase [Lachnospiraceae bacterium]